VVSKHTVIVYRTELLPLSETFIKEQVLAYRCWRAILAGHYLGALSLEGLEVQMLGPLRESLAKRIAYKLGLVPRALPSVLQHISQHKVDNLRCENPSLVHAHFGTDAILAWPLAKELGLPMVVTLHGYDINIHREWWESGRAGEAMRIYPTRLLELAAEPRVHFVAVSNAIRKTAISFGIPEYRISVQYIGIDIRKFVPGAIPISNRQNRILFVGRLVEKKGCKYLIQAMAEVQKKVPDATLIVVGDGPLRTTLEKLARQLQVHIVFRGALPSHEVKQELDTARVFCLPSVTALSGDAEGLPIAILEAQACGVPVVTSARGGAEEGIADGETGYAFPEENTISLADRLVAILTDDLLANNLGEYAPRFVANRFDIRSCTKALEAFYDKIVMPPTADFTA
jgi:colanic acid/amylovoran biosynthesis glycosyltransferase